MTMKIFSTNSLPPVGGAAGALTSQVQIIEYMPTWEAISVAVILSIVGAMTGYIIKLLLDLIIKKYKNSKIL